MNVAHGRAHVPVGVFLRWLSPAGLELIDVGRQFFRPRISPALVQRVRGTALQKKQRYIYIYIISSIHQEVWTEHFTRPYYRDFGGNEWGHAFWFLSAKIIAQPFPFLTISNMKMIFGGIWPLTNAKQRPAANLRRSDKKCGLRLDKLRINWGCPFRHLLLKWIYIYIYMLNCNTENTFENISYWVEKLTTQSTPTDNYDRKAP